MLLIVISKWYDEYQALLHVATKLFDVDWMAE